MEQMGFVQRQSQIQSQIQSMSQRQIQALNILSMNSNELKEKINREVQENPVLNYKRPSKKKSSIDTTRVSSKISSASIMASDIYLEALENHADTRETLQQHLLNQLNLLKLTDAEQELGEKLIYNLDEKGYHILSPLTFIPRYGKSTFNKMLDAIHNMDPSGVGCKNMEESLLIQARLKENFPPLAKFILDGHFDFLDPPRPEKISSRIKDFLKQQKNLFAVKDDYTDLEYSEEKIIEMLKFIRTLDPFPARNFGTSQIRYVNPDVYIYDMNDPENSFTDVDEIITKEDAKFGIVIEDYYSHLEINSDVSNFISSKSSSKNENSKLKENIKHAQEFLENLEYRQNILLDSINLIVKAQIDFFCLGPGNLKPLTQKDLAKKLEVHPSTISRMANSKFLSCKWGMFDLKYFFSPQVSKRCNISQKNAIEEIKKIIEENKYSKKQISDQKICSLLAERGIKISRRTVAKYRAKLNISSSYLR